MEFIHPGACRPLLIVYPVSCQILPSLDAIRGIGAPCANITLTIDCFPPLCTQSNCRGFWEAVLPCALPSGFHEIIALEESCAGCRTACVRFRTTG